MSSLKVLLVNDQFFILEMLKEITSQMNIKHIDTAQNGLDAFLQVKKAQYDFIICDLMMPVMDGHEFAQQTMKHYADQES